MTGVVPHCLHRPVEQKCFSVELQDWLRLLLKATVYSKSWIRNNVFLILSLNSLKLIKREFKASTNTWAAPRALAVAVCPVCWSVCP